jgi:hypothetical protein
MKVNSISPSHLTERIVGIIALKVGNIALNWIINMCFPLYTRGGT